VSETAKTDLVDIYLQIAFADGAQADDPRLAVLRELMTAEEIDRAKRAIGGEWLWRESAPAWPN
jgi:hypothetical protein